MQFKKGQSDFIQNVVDTSDDIRFMKSTKTPDGRKDLYAFLDCPGTVLTFEKRGNHRYWKLEDNP